MTYEDDAMYAAILAQLNAEIKAAGFSVRSFAKHIGNPYDSTGDYLRGDRALSLGFLLQYAEALGITLEEIVTRARRERLKQ